MQKHCNMTTKKYGIESRYFVIWGTEEEETLIVKGSCTEQYKFYLVLLKFIDSFW